MVDAGVSAATACAAATGARGVIVAPRRCRPDASRLLASCRRTLVLSLDCAEGACCRPTRELAAAAPRRRAPRARPARGDRARPRARRVRRGPGRRAAARLHAAFPRSSCWRRRRARRDDLRALPRGRAGALVATALHTTAPWVPTSYARSRCSTRAAPHRRPSAVSTPRQPGCLLTSGARSARPGRRRAGRSTTGVVGAERRRSPHSTTARGARQRDRGRASAPRARFARQPVADAARSPRPRDRRDQPARERRPVRAAASHWR
jgi:hypothetical protein